MLSIFTSFRPKHYIKLYCVLAIVALSGINVANAQLSGTYTIDPNGSGSSNFVSFTKAVDSLVSVGISGAVTFEVADGTYSEQITIPAITGASASDRITFISDSGDSSKVILTSASSTTTTDNFTVYLNGADYITFEKITISRPGTNANGRVVQISNAACFNEFLNCRIISSINNSANSAGFYSAGTNDSNNVFRNNLIKYGYYGFYWYGASASSWESGTVIQGNIIDSFYYYGINSNRQYAATVTNNLIGNARNSSNYGMYIYDNSGNSSNRGLYANNMVFVGSSGTTRTIYLYNSSFVDIVYNSLLNTGSSTTSATIFASAGASTGYTNNRIINNIIVNSGSGYAIDAAANGVNSISLSDYNDLYVTGTNLGRWGTTNYTSLSDWQTGTNMDTNSISVDPKFVSATDLHASAIALNGAATPLSSVTTDFDGDLRDNTLPDIGADEFDPPGNDAGIMAIVGPATGTCAGTHDVIVKVKNYGLDQLDSVYITYLLDGVQQSSTKYNVNVLSGNDTNIVVGSVTTTSTPKTIKVYTSKPNGVTDADNTNDTISVMVKGALTGTYSIGASGDYTTFAAAVADLNNYGVCGAVTFNVANGTYNEQVSIPEIVGASSTNRITFQSTSGDSSAAVISHASGTGNNYTVQLDGADYITFKQLGFKRTGTATAGRVIELAAGATYNEFLNNYLESSITTSSLAAGFYSGSTADNYNLFRNNMIKNGYYGIYLLGSSTDAKQSNVIEGNIIDSFYFYGVYLSYNDEVIVSKNIIRNKNRNTTGHGIYNLNGSGASQFIGNYIHLGGTTANGLWHATGTGSSANPQVSANNMIISDATGTTMGIQLNNVSHHRIVYNSVNMTAGSATAGRAFYGIASTSARTGNEVYNNNFANTGGGYAYEIAAGGITFTIVDTSDHNNIYATGSTTVNIGTTGYTTLADWQAATNWEASSLSVNPRFESATDLHSIAILLNGAATPLSYVTTDFDGDLRDNTSPDIGADEFTPAAFDAGISSLISPAEFTCAGTYDVIVKIRNFGIEDLDSVTITYLLNGIQQTSAKYYVSLASAQDTNIVVGSINLGNTASVIKVFTSAPNGSSDASASNDTIEVSMRAALSGTYTISASGADFTTFNNAVSALQTLGVCGPVTFNVADGTYSEQVTIPEIAGASSTNRITFQSASGDSSKVILTSASSTATADNFTLNLNGADFITFSKMTISRPGTNANGRVVVLGGGANNNRFLNNLIISSVNTSTNSAGFYSAATTDNDNEFVNNQIKYGYYGIYLLGSTTVTKQSNIIIGNIIDSFYFYGVYLSYNDAVIVSGNTVRNQNRNTTGHGIYNLNGSGGSQFIGNYIHTRGTTSNGLWHATGSGTSSAPQVSANNMIISDATGTTMGIFINNVSHHRIVYNSVNITAGSATLGRAFNANASTASTGNHVLNNNFVNSGGGYAYEINAGGITNTIVDSSNYNNIYATGATTVRMGTTNYTTLANWKAVTSLEANSISVDPQFFSSTDLHTKSSNLNAAATPLSYVTTDFDGDLRSTSTPDIGADEFTPPVNDVAVIAIVSPQSNACGDSNTIVGVVIRNFGTASQSNISLEAEITGAGTATLSDTYSGTLGQNASDTFYFSTGFNTYSGGTFNISAFSKLSTDEDRGNDTSKLSVAINAIPPSPTVTGVSICGSGSVDLIATPSTGTFANWFTSATSNTLIYSGDTFSTPVLTQTTTYYVEASAPQSFSVGPKDNSIGTSANFTSPAAQGLLFEVYKTFVLDSVTVYPNGSGDVVVRLADQSNSTITTVTVAVSSSGMVRIPVNMIITPGAYRLDAAGTTTGGLQRNSAGASYPYDINGVVSIYNSTFGLAAYYFFYDWKISTDGCPSPRVPVTATINPLPSGAAITQGSVFNGSFNAGTATNPDEVCAGNTVSYQLTPPTGFNNSGFGSTWAITALTFQTMAGTPAQDTTLTLPGLGNGTMSFTPRANLQDSTLILNVTIRNLSSNCDSIITRYIRVLQVPTASFTVANACVGRQINITDNATGAASYFYRFGDGNTSALQNPTHAYTMAGNYVVTQIITSASGCVDSVTRNITVHPSPEADFVFSNNCVDSSISFTNTSTISSGTASYLWTFGDGDTSTQMSPMHAYAQAGMYDVKLVATSNNGCIDSVTYSVTVYPKPQVAFTANNVCAGDSVSFTNTSTIASGTITYMWNFGDGNTSTNMNPQHLYAMDGNYTVWLKVTSDNGCMDSASQMVVVSAKPLARYMIPQNICVGQPAVFNNMSQDSVNMQLNFMWTFGDGITSTDKNPVHIFNAAGNYEVWLKTGNNNGCEDSVMNMVTVNEKPVAAFMVATGCAGSSVNFVNQSNTTTNPLATYLWSFGDGDTSTAMNPAHTYAMAGNYRAILAVMNENGCIDTISHSVTINEAPVAAINTNDVCIGETSNFVDSSSISTGNIVSRMWYFGDGETSTMQNPQHIYTQTGMYVVSLVVTSDNGCTDSVTHTVTVNALPLADFSYTSNNRTVNFTPSESNHTTYVWHFGDGDSSTTMNAVHTYMADGTYGVTLKVTSAAGCVAEFTDSVTVLGTGIRKVDAGVELNVYPNPFRDQVNVTYQLQKAARVNVSVFDMSGRQITTVVDAQQQTGSYTYSVDATSASIPAGTYFVRVMVDGAVTTKKIVRVR